MALAGGGCFNEAQEHSLFCSTWPLALRRDLVFRCVTELMKLMGTLRSLQ